MVFTAVIPTIAQEQTAEELEAIASAMSALDEFMVAFNSRDMKAWAKTLNYPHVRFEDPVTVWQSAEEFERGATFGGCRTGWDQQKVSRDVCLPLLVKSISIRYSKDSTRKIR